MKPFVVATCIFVGSVGPTVGDTNPSLAWLLAQSGAPLTVHEVGQMTVRGNQMIGVDSLTYSPDYKWPWFAVPQGAARVVALFDENEFAYSKAAVIFSDAKPVCGDDVGTMAVDTGTGAFLDRPMAKALDDLNSNMEPSCNIYDCMMAKQVPDGQFAQMILLPDGTKYPAFSTGFGDGAYPVFLLRDADGIATAAVADFLGVASTFEWLTPPTCPKSTS